LNRKRLVAHVKDCSLLRAELASPMYFDQNSKLGCKHTR